jgi:hypothetical protein
MKIIVFPLTAIPEFPKKFHQKKITNFHLELKNRGKIRESLRQCPSKNPAKLRKTTKIKNKI